MQRERWCTFQSKCISFAIFNDLWAKGTLKCQAGQSDAPEPPENPKKSDRSGGLCHDLDVALFPISHETNVDLTSIGCSVEVLQTCTWADAAL